MTLLSLKKKTKRTIVLNKNDSKQNSENIQIQVK